VIVWCDTREQCPPPFPEGIAIVRVTMSEGDYTTEALQGVGVIERKGCDFVSSLTHDRERFEDELRRLQGYRWRCVVVEHSLADCLKMSAAHPNSIIGSVASLYARWDCPVLFAGSPAWSGRLIAGILRRWEARLIEPKEGT
jgi:ERCC4-type nuclease